MTPPELLYSRTHEWVSVESDASGARIATLGISAFALEQLADLVYIDLPQVGRRVTAGEPLGEVESVKAVSDVYSPVDGEVIEVNAEVTDRLDTLGDDPYQTGWLVKIKISDESGLDKLLDYAAYQKQCQEEMANGE